MAGRSDVCEGRNTKGRPCSNKPRDGDTWCGRCVGHIEKIARSIKREMSPKEVDKLARSRHARIRKTVAAKCRLPHELRTLLLHDPDREVRLAFARRHDLTEAEKEHCYASDDRRMRHWAINHSRILPRWWEILAADECPDVRRYIAAYPGLPSHIIWFLAHSDPEAALGSLAGRNDLPPSIMWKLAEYGDSYANQRLAANKNCPAALLEQLSHDKSQSVRASVARNENVPLATLRRLGHESIPKGDDPDHQNIVYGVCNNPIVPKDMLDLLWDNMSTSGARGLARNNAAECSDLQRLIKEHLPSLYFAERLSTLSAISCRTGADDATLAAVVAHLRQCRTVDIKEDIYRIMSHQNLGPATVGEISRCRSYEVRRSLIQRASQHFDDTVIRRMLKLREEIRSTMAHMPDLPDQYVERLASDPAASVRQAVAKRDDISDELLLILAFDTDNRVAVAATERLAVPIP